MEYGEYTISNFNRETASLETKKEAWEGWKAAQELNESKQYLYIYDLETSQFHEEFKIHKQVMEMIPSISKRNLIHIVIHILNKSFYTKALVNRSGQSSKDRTSSTFEESGLSVTTKHEESILSGSTMW